MASNILKIAPSTMRETLQTLFENYGFTEAKASLLSRTYTNSTIDGVNSHGINRVPLFIEYIEKGQVELNAEAQKVQALGSIERWDGQRGPGIVNAVKCTERAMVLAKKYGMGMVALRNTNHWMRGGTYGWQAADSGCIALLFTNTQPNMPPWGGKHSRLGNNPLIVAIPRKEGHVVLDMAISQFAFGKIKDYGLRGKKLPFPGGWDNTDKLSNDPEKILGNERGLPIGYWKGSALSMVLDMLATVLSAGDSTAKIGKKEYETGISQVYICIYPEHFHDTEIQEKLLKEIIDYTHDVEPMHEGERTYYPGEKTLLTRVENKKEGIPVSEEVWTTILQLTTQK